MKKISLPRIGIRPVTDGRRMGVHESLEEQIVNMVKAAAALLTGKLHRACGATIECVTSNTCIAGMTEAVACEGKFSSQNTGLIIMVTSCWCYGSETIDMDPTHPKTIWGLSDTERPGAIYLAAALTAHSQKGIPAFSIYGHDVQDADDTSIPADVEEKLLHFAHASLVVASMEDKSCLSLDDVSMGIVDSIVDHNLFGSWLEMRVQAVDMTELRRYIDQKIYDGVELEMTLARTDKNFRHGEDESNKQYRRGAEQNRTVLRESLLMAMCIRDMMQGDNKLADIGCVEESLGYNTIAAGFRGQRHWTDQYPNGDAAEVILNSSFDWNGVHEPLVVATESGSLNGVAMLTGRQLTDAAQVLTDMYTYWSPEATERVTGHKLDGLMEHGIIHLISSGSAALDGSCKQHDSGGNPTMKPHQETSQREADACLATTEWCPAIHEYFHGGGYSFRFLTEGDVPFTMTRVNVIKGLGPVLQIAEGQSVELPKGMRDVLNERTNSTWPTTWFAPRLTGKEPFTGVYSVVANWGANHGVLTIDHVGADFITLASVLRIPVCMHSAKETRVYRPSAWTVRGMDIEGQDYRACRNYGPLYKR